MSRFVTLSALVTLGSLAGCSHQTVGVVLPAERPKVAAAKPESMLDAVKTLEGTWTMPDPNGVVKTAAVFSITSSGTAVREVMFPGTEHEMTNMYHMDGNNLIMTHYCAMGNQPRMRAVATDGTTISFAPDSVTNLKDPSIPYMGQMTLTFTDANHVAMDWHSIKGGKPDGSHNAPFTLTRKR